MLRLHALLPLVLCLTVAPALAQEAARPQQSAPTRIRRPLASEHVQPAAEPDPVMVRTPARMQHPQSIGGAARQAAQKKLAKQKSTERKTASTESKSKAAGQSLSEVMETLGAREPFDVSSSGRYLVASCDAGLMLADARQGRQLKTLADSLREYQLVKISSDARWIVGVRADDPDSIDLWRADNGKHVRTIAAAGGAKSAIEFSSPNELSVSTSKGNGVVYSIPAGEMVGGFASGNGGSGVSAGIGSGSASPQAMIRNEASQDASAAPLGNPIRPQRATPKAQPHPSATLAAPRAKPAPQSAAAAPPAAEPQAAVAAPEEPAPSAAPMAAAPDEASDYPAPGVAPMAPPAASPRRYMMQAEEQSPPPTAEPYTAEPTAAEPSATAPAPRKEMSLGSAKFGAAAPAETFAVEAPAGGAAPPVDSIAAEPTTAEPFISSEPAGGASSVPAPTTPAQLAAAADPQIPPPPEEDLSHVTVHFATNRNRLTATDREWMVYFQGFFFSLPAFVVYAFIVVSLLVFPWLGKRAWAAAALGTGVVVLLSMASIEAYVRSQLRDELSGEMYGSRPTELSYGACQISVPMPENRSAGELNRPLSAWVFEAPENAEKHFVLRKVDEHANKDEFFKSLSAQLERSQDGASLLFIHGYNVSFEDAVFRTAQLAVDLKFRGAPISFSWPSYADPVKYTFDEQNAEVSIPSLREFLEDLSTRSGAKRIHIVAHSMGNRVLAGALRSMSPEARVKNKAMFREIVLAAPDIDSRVFQSQVLPHIKDNTEHCTLYASSRDRALLLSRYFHNYQRLGETQPQLIVADGMDTIDASLVDTSLLGHSYIGDVKSIVSDLHDLVVSGKRPKERGGLESELFGELMYWAIRPEVRVATEPDERR
jgi:esterase/lipase superfamily enzyme